MHSVFQALYQLLRFNSDKSQIIFATGPIF